MASPTRNRQRQIGARTLLTASMLAVAVVVSSSLNSEHYFFRSDEARRAFVPDPRDVATAFALSTGEGLVLCLIVCTGPRTRLWRRLLFALVVFVPWLFVIWGQIGTHVPGFVMLNALWVALIVMFLTGAILILFASQIAGRMRLE